MNNNIQINDEGHVIGYKPNLQYQTEKRTVGLSEENDSPIPDLKKENSKLIKESIKNKPSKMLKDINFSIDNLKNLIEKLSKSFKENNWDKYNKISDMLNAIEYNNQEYIKDFVEFHKENINGSIIPEIINDINNSIIFLNNFKKEFKELFYGKDLTLEESEKIDDLYYNKIKEFESSNKEEKINYMTLSYDSSLNKSISMQSFNISKKCIDMSDILINKINSKYSSEKEYLLKELYDEINNKIKIREKRQQNEDTIEIMKKTLYNYYEKRKRLIDLYDLFIDNNDENIFLGSKIIEYQKEMENSIEEINKIFYFLGNELSEKTKLRLEKFYIMNIDSLRNYNF